MADITDAFGRNISNIDANVSAIKAALLQDLGKSKTNVSSANDAAAQQATINISKQLNTIVGYNLNVQFNNFLRALKKIEKCCDDTNKSKKNKQKRDKQEAKDIGEAFAKAFTSMGGANSKEFSAQAIGEAFAKVLTSKKASNQMRGGGYSTALIPGQPSALTKKEQQEEAKLLKQEAKLRQQTMKDLGSKLGGAVPGFASRSYDQVKQASDSGDSKQIINSLAGGVSKGIGGAMSVLGGALGTALGSPAAGAFVGGFAGNFSGGLLDLIFKPLADRMEATSDRAATIYRQFGAQGKDMIQIQQELLITDKDYRDTGISELKLRNQLNKSGKRGLNDTKEVVKVTKAGAQLSSQIGSNAEQTADMFADWNMHLGLSGNQLNVVSKNMFQIARQTGVSGDNLVRVAQASQQFMTAMRGAGTFTAEAATNITGFLARAEKAGNSPAAQRIMGVLQKSTINAQDQKTANLLNIASGGDQDVMNDLISGTVPNSKRSQGILGQGMLNKLNSIIRQMTGKGSMKELTPQEAGRVSIVTEQALGSGAQEIFLAANHLIDGAKDFGQQIADLRKDKKLSPETIKTNEQEMTFRAASTELAKFSTILERNNGDVAKSFTELRNSSTDLAPLLKHLGGNAEDGAKALGVLLKEQYKQIQGGIGQYGLKGKLGEDEVTQNQFDDAMTKLSAGNVKPMQDISERFNRIESRIASEKRISQDPMAKGMRELESAMNKLGDAVENFLLQNMEDLIALVDKVIPILEKLINVVIPALITTLDEILKFIKGLWGTPEQQAAIAQGNNSVQALAGANEGLTPKVLSERSVEQLQAIIEEQKTNIKNNQAWYDSLNKEIDESYMSRIGRQGLKQTFYDVAGRRDITLAEQSIQAQEAIEKSLEIQRKTQLELSERMSKPGSIYTHDEHLEEILKDMLNSAEQGAVSTMMPGMNVDDEIRRRQIASDNNDAEIEANTNETANNTRRTNALLGTLLSMIAKGARKSGTDTAIEGENVDESVFWDMILDTDWVDTTGRTVGLNWAQGNPGKHL